jgi:hypothetical protein
LAQKRGDVLAVLSLALPLLFCWLMFGNVFGKRWTLLRSWVLMSFGMCVWAKGTLAEAGYGSVYVIMHEGAHLTRTLGTFLGEHMRVYHALGM